MVFQEPSVTTGTLPYSHLDQSETETETETHFCDLVVLRVGVNWPDIPSYWQ